MSLESPSDLEAALMAKPSVEILPVVVDILLALKGGDSNYATWKVGS